MQGLGEAALTARALKLPIDAVVVVRSDGPPTLVAVYRDGTRRGPTPLLAAHQAPPAPAPSPPAPRSEPPTPAPRAETPPMAPTPAPAPRAETPPMAPTPAPAPRAETPPPTAPTATTRWVTTTPTPSPPPPPSAPTPAQARATYDDNVIGFREFPSVTKVQPYQGRYQRLLLWPEFYTKTGRPDLTSRALDRRAWSRGLLAGGILVGIGGLVALFAQTGINACNPTSSDCHPSAAGYLAFGVLSGAGVAFTLGGSLMSTQVEPAWEARRLGDVYNQRLRAELGLAR
jgi:hypothetical protein